MSPVLITHSLSKRYGAFAALEDCNLQVAAGEVFGLLGPNGSGKTTLLRLVLGYLRPSKGSAAVEGIDCYRRSTEVHRRITYLPAETRLFPEMRGRDVLRFFAEARRQDSMTARSLALAERLDLDVSRRVSQLSTGMKQKLALCGVFAADTPLVILDEPTANLDPTIRGEVLAITREARDAGRTVIFSSHVLSEVEQTCDRVALLRCGQVACEQTLGELRRQHRIRAILTGPMRPPADDLSRQVKIERDADNRLTIETPGELSPLLGWLATLPLAEVQIEPFGLQAIYDRYHPPAN